MIDIKENYLALMIFFSLSIQAADFMPNTFKSQMPSARCWAIVSDHVRDTLLSPQWRDCSRQGIDFSTEAGYEYLISEAKKRLRQEGRRAPEMLKVTRIKFDTYIIENALDKGWVKSSKSLEDIAKKFFPDDEIMQAVSVLHMMVYFIDFHKNRYQRSMMFRGTPKFQKGQHDWNVYFSAILTGLISPAECSVGPGSLYLLQKNYQFSFLDFIVCMRNFGPLMVIPEKWDEEHSAHQGDIMGVFDLLVRHDFLHGCNIETLMAILQVCDSNFKNHCNFCIDNMLRKVWTERGPEALTGTFFLFHEVLGTIFDIDGKILFTNESPKEKIHQILLSGARRAVIDRDLYTIVKDIHPNSSLVSFNAKKELYAMTKEVVDAFIFCYNPFAPLKSLSPYEQVEQEWLEDYDGYNSVWDIFQRVCDFAHATDKQVPPVVIVKGVDVQLNIIPLKREGVLQFHLVVGGVIVKCIPTKQVIESYTLTQKQQMVSHMKKFNLICLKDFLLDAVQKQSLSTRNLLLVLPSNIVEKIIGKGQDASKLWRKEALKDLWKQLDAQNRAKVNSATDLAVGLLTSCGWEEDATILRTLCDKIIQPYDLRKEWEDLLFIMIVQNHIQKKITSTHQTLPINGASLKASIASLIEPLTSFTFLPRCCFSEDAPTLLEHAVICSKEEYWIQIMDPHSTDYVSVYDQFVHIKNQEFNRSICTLRMQNSLTMLKKNLRIQTMQVWEDIGVFYLLGARLFFDYCTLPTLPVECIKRNDEILMHSVYPGIEEAVVPEDSITQELKRYFEGDSFYPFRKKVMYIFASYFYK